ncbi:gamma carbonic anhydrase family protein [Micromonospora sicca]|uniref:Gamma carbonic anhydrase family protein n=1 Tax=Micromonospora sicca TaxID=2202420 RepID=A0A317DX47_9ACTN|nr:gamma carbonic anhydrase family protein [Micromonospora sp. 4G51]PWR17415.1 gamma carbonic anhydrase family protein [Micromonospora sp. 4G51]
MSVVEPMLLPFGGTEPEVAEEAWVAPGATVIGAVRLLPRSSVWYTAVLRGDGDTITIGAGSNIQDGCVVHADPGFPVRIGSGVSVGHRAVLHGCTVEDDVLIGMGAIVLNGAVIGRGSIVAAGAVVFGNVVIPPNSLVVGVPARVIRELNADEVETVRTNARIYLERAPQHARITASQRVG